MHCAMLWARRDGRRYDVQCDNHLVLDHPIGDAFANDDGIVADDSGLRLNDREALLRHFVSQGVRMNRFQKPHAPGNPTSNASQP